MLKERWSQARARLQDRRVFRAPRWRRLRTATQSHGKPPASAPCPKFCPFADGTIARAGLQHRGSAEHLRYEAFGQLGADDVVPDSVTGVEFGASLRIRPH